MKNATITLKVGDEELETVEASRVLVIADDGEEGRILRYNVREFGSVAYLVDAAMGSMLEEDVPNKDLGYMMFITYLTLASVAYETTLTHKDMDTHDMFDIAMEIDRYLKKTQNVIMKRHEGTE